MKKETPKGKAPRKKAKVEEVAPPRPKFYLGEGMNLMEAAERIGLKSRDLADRLAARGHILDYDDLIDENLAALIGQSVEADVEFLTYEKEVRLRAESSKSDLVTRPPVVTIMGHVDHGKTTLLDAIRSSNLVGKEWGGITQHIGAYRVLCGNRSITFIDTPGHEAFTQLRARGARLTDIVVLVVAADDGVMPQTQEAISHARAAGVPIIVAINKIDKPEANVDRVKQQLAKEGLLVEDWGGDVISVDVSAKEKKNLSELLEMILLLADVLEIKANTKVEAQGVVLEARLDLKKGPVATVIIQHGVLSTGQHFICGLTSGKVRALFDENGRPIKKAEPSMPVEVLGFTEVPSAGDYFQVITDPERAKRIITFRQSKLKKGEPPRPERLTLDELFKKLEGGEVKELPLILKADVHGSVEVLQDILPRLGTEKIKIKLIHSGTGTITESDVLLASASNAIIIGFNVKPNPRILEMAKQEKVEIRSYNIIYQLTEDIRRALEGMLEPVRKEVYLGKAEIRRVFQIPKVGAVAGCYVLDGKIPRNAEVKVMRNQEEIHRGRIASLRRVKENVSEVGKGLECGIALEKFKDIQEGDILIAFTTEVARPA